MDFYYKKTERYVSFANTGGKGIPNPARPLLLEDCLDYPFEEQATCRMLPPFISQESIPRYWDAIPQFTYEEARLVVRPRLSQSEASLASCGKS